MAAASLHRLPSSPKLDYRLVMAGKVEWAAVAAALVLAVPLWRTKNRGPEAGDVVEEPITLVPEDRERLSCALDHAVGRYACAFRSETEKTEPAPAKDAVLAPCMTTSRSMYLVAGLFEERNVAQYLSRHYENRRFTAQCKLRLLELVDRYELRFRSETPWGKGQAAWVAEPVSCVARTE
jgi:hypothetical protein